MVFYVQEPMGGFIVHSTPSVRLSNITALAQLSNITALARLINITTLLPPTLPPSRTY
jgi:hypothetical protein